MKRRIISIKGENRPGQIPKRTPAKLLDGAGSVPLPGVLDQGTPEFNETVYCSVFKDVAAAISSGRFSSGSAHYSADRKHDDRLKDQRYWRNLGYKTWPPPARSDGQLAVDGVWMSNEGWVLVVGWVDDRDVPIRGVSFFSAIGAVNTFAVGRSRRSDVESALKSRPVTPYGFWTLLRLIPDERMAPQRLRGECVVRSIYDDGSCHDVTTTPCLVSNEELRIRALAYLASREYFGNRDAEAYASLETGLGRALVGLNRAVNSALAQGSYVERFGNQRSKYDMSIITCIYGKPEFIFLRAAAISLEKSRHTCEHIFICNSPELSETIFSNSQINQIIYNFSSTVVVLPGNIGFGGGSNFGASLARSNRVVFMNPDVFSRNNKTLEAHANILNSMPSYKTTLFGSSLYYDDGSLMHGGMYFETDRKLLIRTGGVTPVDILRVEHYGKGSPPDIATLRESRPVPAVTGAFISVEKKWFENIGGFSDDYVFGHYEDADLCLKSTLRGVTPWIHDLGLWHLEGKGSNGSTVHEGSGLVNRWLFTTLWKDHIVASDLSSLSTKIPRRSEP